VLQSCAAVFLDGGANQGPVREIRGLPRPYFRAERGGQIGRAIHLYRRMLEVAPREDPRSPLPDWGTPEAHMSRPAPAPARPPVL